MDHGPQDDDAAGGLIIEALGQQETVGDNVEFAVLVGSDDPASFFLIAIIDGCRAHTGCTKCFGDVFRVFDRGAESHRRPALGPGVQLFDHGLVVFGRIEDLGDLALIAFALCLVAKECDPLLGIAEAYGKSTRLDQVTQIDQLLDVNAIDDIAEFRRQGKAICPIWRSRKPKSALTG